MTPIAHRLGLYSIPLLASLALPVWAAGPVGLGYLKMGMNKSAIEQGACDQPNPTQRDDQYMKTCAYIQVLHLVL